jgi:hypothetical protein
MLEAVLLLFCGYVLLQAVVTICRAVDGDLFHCRGSEVLIVLGGILALASVLAAVLVWRSADTARTILGAIR